MSSVCRYDLPPGTTRDFLEERISLGVLLAECLFGKARVRLEAGYCISADVTRCAVDTTTDVGDHIARVLTGLLIRDLGDLAFSVERVGGAVTDAVRI